MVFWLALAGFGSGLHAAAQSGTDGAIGGQVVSAAGSPVPGAVVAVHDTETGLAVRTLSGTKGEFLLVRLPVGQYQLSVQQMGVELTLAGSVMVELGEVTEVQARMQSGGSGSPGLPNTPGSEGTDVANADLADLPINGGQWRSLTLTVAGANAAADADGNAADVSFRGVAVTENSSRTDGASGDQSFSGAGTGTGVEEEVETGSDEVDDRAAGVGSGSGSVADGGQRAGAAYVFSQASVREFRVLGQASAAAYGSALYGHGVGGVVTTVSRSGGTRLHGMAFYTLRQSAWAAANPFSVQSNYDNGVVTSSVVKPSDQRQQFGGSIGGPVPGFRSGANYGGWTRSNTDQGQRLFYFYAFDAQHRNFPAISAPGYAGFYSLTASQKALLANRGVTPAQTNTALNYLDSLTGTVARKSNQTVNFGRVDWQHGSGSRVVLEYNRTRWSSPAGARTEPVVDRAVASIGSSYGKVDAGVARWVQFVNRNLSNELRVQYGRQLQYESAQTPLAQEPDIGPGGMPPEVSIGPQGLVFGTPSALGQKAYPDERRFEVADLMGWLRGRHFLQFGGDFSAISDTTDSLTNAEGTFSYDSSTTTVTGGQVTPVSLGGLVDWITDYTFNVNAYPNGECRPSQGSSLHYSCFRSYAQSFGQQSLTFHTQEWAGFFQDDWRATQRLTIHAGLRYEYQLLPLPQQPNAALDVVFGAVGATSVFPEDRNNFGPRLGVAWQPFGVGRGVLRIGYGIYYGKLPGATIRAALLDTALPSSVTRVRILPTTVTACPQSATGVGFGYACSYLTPPTGVVAATTSAIVFDRRFRLPMVQQGTLSIEHGLGAGMLGSAGYVLNLDRQLPNSVDINIAPSTDVQEFQLQGGTGAVGVRDGEMFAVPVYSARITPSFGPVTDLVSNANASYHGLTLEAQRGLGAGRDGYSGGVRALDFRIAWTWSKAIDFGQSAGAAPRANGQFDPFTVRYDKGLSALNFPHRVVASAVWSPQPSSALARFGEPGRLLRTAADGWSMAWIFYEASGRGYSYDIFGGTRLPGGHESINGSGGSVVLPTVGRNTLRLPDFVNLDMRLSRSFRLREGLHLRVSAEAFNLTNHLNYSGITQRAFLVNTPGTGTAPTGVTPLVFQDAAAVAGVNVQPFGAFTAAGTNQARERQIQLGLRLEF
ncbi:MAG: carboxypeptidase regulatory-like domain-containing protein [Acidobacteriaceae bacterium]